MIPWPEDDAAAGGVCGVAGEATRGTDGGVATLVIGESMIDVGVALATRLAVVGVAALVLNGEGMPIEVGVCTDDCDGLDGTPLSWACKLAMVGVTGGGTGDGGLCMMNAS